MPINSFRYSKDKETLFMPEKVFEYGYEKISGYIKRKFPGFTVISRGLWEYQQKYLNPDSDAVGAVRIKKDYDLELKGLSEIKKYSDYKALIRVMGIYDRIFHKRDIKELPACPKTVFYNNTDLICKFSCDHFHSDFPVHEDKDTVSVNRVEGYVEYYANGSGYLDLSQGKISLVDPVYIEPEDIRMHVVIVPITEEIKWRFDEYMENIIQEHRLSYPDARIMIQSASEFKDLYNGEGMRTITICDGEDPDPGRSAELIIKKEEEHEEEGSIDYHDVKQYTAVHKGDVIAEKMKMVESSDGFNIYGKEVVMDRNSDLDVHLEGDIKEEEAEDRIKYIAGDGGLISYTANSLELTSEFVVEEDVDYKTGNIDFDKKVEVKGDVKAGFSVKSREDIIVHGVVENGARIESGGKSLLLGGVLGEDTIINSKGSVKIAFFQDAEIYAGGDVYIVKNVLRGHIFCKGKLTVEGKGLNAKRHGAICGGSYTAMGGMDLHSIGSEASESSFTVGHNREMTEQIHKGQKDIAAYQREQLKIMQNMPVDLSTSAGKERLKSLSMQMKRKIKENLVKMKKYSDAREKISDKMIDWFREEYVQIPDLKPINVFENLHGKNTVSLARKSQEYIFTDERKMKFTADEEGIKMEKLSGETPASPDIK